MRALTSAREHAEARFEPPPALRFLSELVAWIATPWALASHSPVLAGAVLLLLIGLPAVFATPGDKKQMVVAVPGQVTILMVVMQLVAAAVAAWAAWPVPAALLVWVLVVLTVYAELPRWRRLTGGDLTPARPLRLVNEGLAFVVELLAFAALAWWGAVTGGGLAVHLLLGIGAPLLAVVVWGLYASPRAVARLSRGGVLVVKALVFGAATFALDLVGHRSLAVLFAVVAAANTGIAALDREAAARRPPA